MITIKVLFMDVDGTLTDGKIYVGCDGEIMKAFNVRDGYGIANILPSNEIIPVVITNRKSEIIINRCKELGIEYVYQECKDKKKKIIDFSTELGLRICSDGIIQGTAYIGDDIPDIEAMKICEYVGCPADATCEVKEQSDYVCSHIGGGGAVREFIEWIIKKSNEK